MDFNKETDMGKLEDRIKGIIFGAALGDAVGLSTEFMNKTTAKTLYGNGPIRFGSAKGHEFWRDGHRSRWHENDFTDDTDQLLLILQCFLQSDGDLIPSHFAFRLKEWTHLGFPELHGKLACGIGRTVGSTLRHPDFLTNPHLASYQVWDRTGRNMAANGAVMRTSVLGIPFFWDEVKVAQNAIKCAKVTHADPRSVFSSVIVSVLISRILRQVLGQEESVFRHRLSSDDRGKLIELMESGSKSMMEQGPLEKSSGLIPKQPFQKEENETDQASSGFLASLREKIGKFLKLDKANVDNFAGWPKYPEPDKGRITSPAKIIQKLIPLDLDVHPELDKLVQEVLEEYMFLLTDSEILCSVESSQLWIEEMEKYCGNMAAKKLGDFQLDEGSSIGYTYKCLGAALFCLTRQWPKKDCDEAEFFKQVITSLTLEAGDADTNCAVAGALLGARMGYSALPRDWVGGLRHAEFLTGICSELCQLVVNSAK